MWRLQCSVWFEKGEDPWRIQSMRRSFWGRSSSRFLTLTDILSKYTFFLRLRISLCCSVQADKWIRFYQNAYWCTGLTYCFGLNGGRKAGSQYDLHSFTSSNRGSSSSYIALWLCEARRGGGTVCLNGFYLDISGAARCFSKSKVWAWDDYKLQIHFHSDP